MHKALAKKTKSTSSIGEPFDDVDREEADFVQSERAVAEALAVQDKIEPTTIFKPYPIATGWTGKFIFNAGTELL